MTTRLTIGERVAWYRRRRGLSQEVLAGLVDRTTDWLSRIENNRIDLDRLSVVKALADALDVSVGDLLAEPSLMEWTPDGGRRTVPSLRDALLDYRQITPLAGVDDGPEPPRLDELQRAVSDVWDAYQASRYGYATRRLPPLIAEAQSAARAYDGDEALRAEALLALSQQAAAMTLTKVGEADLAWVASDRGLAAAQRSGDPVVIGSLFRSVAHSLLSNAGYAAAVQLTRDAATYLRPSLRRASPQLLSIYGTLLLAGSVAAARADDRATAREFLDDAANSARLLGRDSNYLWTAFGPTNVAIHRVVVAMELGDVQVAVDLGARVNTESLPIERRVRHSLEVARAYSAWNRTEDALALVLTAEQLAPEQVRYHFLSRQLVLTWIKQQRTPPSLALSGLAQRLHVG